ncbi:MAG: N-acetyl sugar amidotransferase [Pseudomonadota bacterium]|nr:N-acetyl sugar amidotransferase [Pseudomonadota bacterium]
MEKLRWCSNCLSMSTRPRITFDEEGRCNACQWMESKKAINWEERNGQLYKLLDKHRSNNNGFDCLVPVSGGKDSGYVSYNLKHKYGMHPLCLTINPALPMEIGKKNLEGFVKSGYNLISIDPSYEAMRTLNRLGLIHMGFPYYGWQISILAGVVRMSFQMQISLIFYGEDGEVEYGGTTETSENPYYDINYMKKIYLEGGYEEVINKANLTESELYFFRFPTDESLRSHPLEIAHWSYFENWDPYRNYLISKEHCGLQEADSSNSGTFTNFAQNDQVLYALHTYLMYLKFGFGRATQDASIEIRRGAMDRNQALNLVKLYDGHFPIESEQLYLNYFQMSVEEFRSTLIRWANTDLFDTTHFPPRPKFKIQ